MIFYHRKSLVILAGVGTVGYHGLLPKLRHKVLLVVVSCGARLFLSPLFFSQRFPL